MTETSTARILYMEDDASLLRLVQLALERHGHVVIPARDGREGLEKLAQEAVNLVLIDLWMPQLGGLEVLRALQRTDNPPPAIVISASTTLSDAVEAMRLGAVDYVSKSNGASYLELLPALIARALVTRRLKAEREAAEAARRESELRFRSIYDHSSFGIAVLQGPVLVRANPALQAMLGWSEADLCRIGLGGISAPEDVALEALLLEELAEGRRDCFSRERRLFTRTRQVVWVRLTVTAVGELASPGRELVLLIEEVTERRQREHQLRDSRRHAERMQAQLRDAIDSISDGFALWDAADRLVLWNERYARLFTPNHPGLLTVGLGFAALMALLEAPIAGNFKNGGEASDAALLLDHHRRASGTLECLLPSGRWILISDRRTSDGGTVSISTDVTEFKHQQQRLADSEARAHATRIEAELASQAKSQFLAAMSHEIRTPLNSVIGFAEIIGGEMLGPCNVPRYIEYARDIQASGEHLLSVVNDVLDLAKIEAGRLELCEETLDVVRVIHSATRLIIERVSNHGLMLVHELPETLPMLRGDVRLIRQMLLNLLSNSIKFTLSGGTITVRATLPDAGGLWLSVADTGIGMAAADIPKALEPFGQVDDPLVRRHTGTGLGLPLVRKLIELHSGQLLIASTPGAGTVVTLCFPSQRILPPHPAASA